jgi:hypothetical protein
MVQGREERIIERRNEYQAELESLANKSEHLLPRKWASTKAYSEFQNAPVWPIDSQQFVTLFFANAIPLFVSLAGTLLSII